MNNVVERLRSELEEVQQEAAIDIATGTIKKNLAKEAAPFLKEILQTATSEKQGTAASALANIARHHPETVPDIEQELISLLRDDTVYQDHYYNATQAVTALASIESETSLDSVNNAIRWYREENAHRAWAAGKLTTNYLTPSQADAVDYKHIDSVRAHGVALLAQNHLDDSDDDYTVAAILLDDILTKNAQDELRDMLLEGARNHPERLENVVPYLAQNIRDRQHQSGEYALWILRNYVEVNPEELTHLVDDVGAYLDPAQGANDPGSPTNILAEVVSFAPGRVADFREQIEELQDHDKEYVQQYCSIILETLDEMDYTSTSERKATDSDWSSNKQGRDTASSSAEADETESEQMLDDLREAAEQDSVETVLKETITTTQETQEYSRSKKVKQYVKARANGYCEGCGDPAPFTSKTGEPYLHAHHVHEISDGGSDTPETVIALCPNCHYRVHHGEDGELYNEELITQLKEIEA